ncbi:MAG: nucleoside-diphosphate sugar epimerase/dehydratase [Scytonema sp. PMC 1069.18]|nr:nucleoside-diphosphate sugar epimerase/dehydratase [Scytonema sp. PMC 1069.18]MEC4883126.1 nucleoside-diphosphate sugar epimerase/dehydratase [Scytonema sp. PMC 1070.18]
MSSHTWNQKLNNCLLTTLLKLRNRHLFICDILVFFITPSLALLFRLDSHQALNSYISELAVVTILFLLVKLSIFWICGFYRRYWRYASIEELLYISILMTTAVSIQTLSFSVLVYVDFIVNKVLQLLPLLDGLLSFIFIVALRFSIRIVERISLQYAALNLTERVLIIGAGSAGASLVEQMQRNPQLGFHPVAFIDDDPKKLHACIRGIPVVGNRNLIPEIVKSLEIHKAIIAMPTVSGQVIREILSICKATGIQTNTLPGIHEILSDRVRVDSIRDVRIEDLLRREPIQTDIEGVYQFLQGKKVLITGAGGSIGSELCRQIFKCYPAEIMLIGHGENSVFSIQQELEQVAQVLKDDNKAQRPTPRLYAFIADIRFQNRIKQGFEQFQPDVIFHAAAHKHVPLMELNPAEAITNNVVGTKNLLELALQYNVKHFVMISTDKAVNPTNVMGASKRVAEMLVLQAARESGNSYVAVRFGNVLGSRGSVVPTFKKQIAAGGPLTVTHPDICRYFMTIPEAVQLVLQAALLGHSGEVLMMNMGKPVKIADLAKELIRLSGYEANKDIEIVYTGLRPGEKLYEELFIPGEEYEPTQHDKLFVVKNASRMIPKDIDINVEALCQAAANNDVNSIWSWLKQMVTGYNCKCIDSHVPVDTITNTTIVTTSNQNRLAQVGANLG